MRHHRLGGAAVMAVLASLSFVVASCSGSDAGGPAGISAAPADTPSGTSPIALSSKADTIQVDQSLRLTATIPANLGSSTAPAPVWTSSDPTVATVAQDGLVFALKSGQTNVTITSRGASASTTITVKPSIRLVRFDTDTLAVGLSQSAPAPYHVIDSDGNTVDIASHDAQWSSTAPDIAPVTSEATITGKSLGSADVRLTVDGKASMVRVQVKPQSVSSVTISPSPLTVAAGQSAQLSATLTDASGNTLAKRSIAWSTNNPAVALVSSTGFVTAVGAGTAKVTAVSENKRSSVAVTVTAAMGSTPPPPSVPTVSTVSVALATNTLTTGQSTQATAVLRDSASNVLTGRTITWSTSDAAVATVSVDGLVTAVKAGPVSITASAEGKSGSASATVSAPIVAPSTITVTTNATTLRVGEFTQATAVVKDVNGTVMPDVTVTWSSTPTSVVAISSNGLAQARSAGSATITAAASGVTGSTSLTVVDTTTPPPAIARIVVALPASTLTVGATTQGSATAYDANGRVITGVTMVWSSSNTGVASVSASGSIKALVAGAATIMAASGGQVGSAPLTVTSIATPTGIAINPGESIQAKVNAYPTGTTFLIKAGTHTGQTVVPKSGDTFIGEPGAILDGGTQLSAFTRGSAPYPSNVTIRGLEIRNYGPTSSSGDFYGNGAISAGSHLSSDGTRGWVVDSNYIHDNRGVGIRIGHRMLVRGNRITRNAGPYPLTGIGDSTVIESNELADGNYTNQFVVGNGAGGFKIVLSTGVMIRKNWIHGNHGPGAWGDIANRSMTFDGNTIEDNTHTGIFYEISYTCRVVNNVVRRNGKGDAANWMYPAGILIAHSPDCEVANNTVSDNVHGIIGIQQTRTDDALYGPHELKNLWVHDNTVTVGTSGYAAGVGSGVGPAPFAAAANNRFDRNGYTVTSGNSWPFTWADGGRSWSTWRGYGQDASSTIR